MILDRLIELSDRIPDKIPRHHKRQNIKWVLAITSNGEISGIIPAGEDGKGWESPAPYAIRSSGTTPFLLVDKPEYVLALDERETPSKRALQRHQAYLDLLEDVLHTTKNPNLRVVVQALSDTEQLQEIRNELVSQGKNLIKRKPGESDDDYEKRVIDGISGTNIAPRVGETYLHLDSVLQQEWQAIQDDIAAQKSDLTCACLLCGNVGPIASKHPIEVFIGPDKAPLISSNKNAFRSYGLKNSEIAPLCFECSERYGEALRYLANSEEHRLRLGPVTWLFWTREPSKTGLASLFTDPQPSEVEALLTSVRRGTHPSDEFESNRFYALVVSGNRKRMTVHSWIDQSLPEAQRHLATYFKTQRITKRNGDTSPLKLLALAGATVRDLDDLPPQTLDLLLRHALLGASQAPLPPSLLHQALRRAHVENDQPVPRHRAALIRLVLESIHSPNKPMTSEALNPNHSEPAYHCGRLLALLDDIQRAALNQTGATIIDRFYGSASTTPAAVFGTLMRKAQPHLGKLRKTKGGLYHFFQQALAEISTHIDRFPKTLTPEQQGLFALGFYHQQNRPKKNKDNVDIADSSD